MNDNVKHPDHYTQGGIECIEAIKGMTGDGFADYLRGNILKYLWRYKHKNGREDLLKARQYLDWLIENTPKTDCMQTASTARRTRHVFGVGELGKMTLTTEPNPINKGLKGEGCEECEVCSEDIGDYCVSRTEGKAVQNV